MRCWHEGCLNYAVRQGLITTGSELDLRWMCEEHYQTDAMETKEMPGINQITRDDVTRFAMHSYMNMYQNMATKSAIYPGKGYTTGLMYVALKLNGEAGEFAEHVGKALRDDDLWNTALTYDRRVALIKEIGDVLWYLSAACNELGITLSDAAEENLRKLCDRTERGALRGSGDER